MMFRENTSTNAQRNISGKKGVVVICSIMIILSCNVLASFLRGLDEGVPFFSLIFSSTLVNSFARLY